MKNEDDLNKIAECINLLDYRYGVGIDDGFDKMSSLMDKIVKNGDAHHLANYLTHVIVDIANGKSWHYGQVLTMLKKKEHLKYETATQIDLAHIKKLYEQKGLNYEEIHAS